MANATGLRAATVVKPEDARQVSALAWRATGQLTGADDFRAAVASEAIASGHRRRGHASAAARNRHVP
jgi:hypothetical protein